MDTVLLGSDRELCLHSLNNKWGRLVKGNASGVQGTDTIEFITKQEVPSNRDVTYATFVLDFDSLETEQYQVRIVVGRDKLTCPFDTGSPATNMLKTKIIISSTISDVHKGA